MAIKITFILLLCSFISLGSSNQKCISPVEVDTVVSVVRTTGFGSALTFSFFHNQCFVDAFKGKSCLRYELSSGKQLPWAYSQNRHFLDCDLKSGDTYFISSINSPGLGKVMSCFTLFQPMMKNN